MQSDTYPNLRTHDHHVSCEVITPENYRTQGHQLTIYWCFYDSPFGRILIGRVKKGICWLSFVINDDREQAYRMLMAQWGKARMSYDPDATLSMIDHLVTCSDPQCKTVVPVILCGTSFQINVWQALLRIPLGHVVCYQDIAYAIGHPKAVRAVGHSVSHNRVSLIVPCHRVIGKNGPIHHYRWQPERKRALLAWEGIQGLKKEEDTITKKNDSLRHQPWYTGPVDDLVSTRLQ